MGWGKNISPPSYIVKPPEIIYMSRKQLDQVDKCQRAFRQQEKMEMHLME